MLAWLSKLYEYRPSSTKVQKNYVSVHFCCIICERRCNILASRSVISIWMPPIFTLVCSYPWSTAVGGVATALDTAAGDRDNEVSGSDSEPDYWQAECRLSTPMPDRTITRHHDYSLITFACIQPAGRRRSARLYDVASPQPPQPRHPCCNFRRD